MTRVIDIGVHILEVGCIGLLTWIVKIGRREFLESVDARAAAAARGIVQQVEAKVTDLSEKFTEHELLDEFRHNQVMQALGQKQA